MITEDGVINDDLLQQLNQLVGQVGGHEGLDGDGDVLGVLSLGQRRLDHLIDQRPPILVLVVQHLGPELHVASLDQVAGLRLEEGVLVADGDQLAVALPALVGHAGQVGVALLAVAADDLAVVVGVFPLKKEEEEKIYY